MVFAVVRGERETLRPAAVAQGYRGKGKALLLSNLIAGPQVGGAAGARELPRRRREGGRA